ncbi:type I DNA topoisomerase [Sinimarinibacterium sp. NLF-5-8]|uniref:type I DNA topoisomerase n=1 Tax=Sinimarinibacterium sp. NLF-5-8 TaxID=2698684 RepID=UPI00137B9404|nr:type I DNA topoisomerase [Sinimarinibacterium sp. NLF-5-8]QHS09005.1 type I DNA topoisomerase [Sinimarinibacterium sp. NLF-5-8]
MSNLLIVESPSKAKSIGAMLGSGWIVQASMGHVRDLPVKTIGIDRSTLAIDYIETEKGASTLARLRSALSRAQTVYLATDPDREGEAIAWHLAQALKLKPGTYHRVTYNEITETAIRKAIDSPRQIDMALVDAQQARRALDRIVGYVVSPRLWQQSTDRALRLSAGRVQTPTTRLVVERDRAIESFKPVNHFGVEIDLASTPAFTAKWITTPYQKSEDEPYVLDKTLAELVSKTPQVTVTRFQQGTRAQNAPPPFTTAAMQQAANVKLDLSANDTMKLAQSLFENHHAITYHRTDSVTLADEAIEQIRKYASGKQYPLPDKPNIHASKVANAQEAHEAIRPTDPFNEAPAGVYGKELELYKLIHRQAVASQLAPCILKTRSITLASVAFGEHAAGAFDFEAKGQQVLERGFTVLGNAPKETELPKVIQGDILNITEGRLLLQATKAPPAFTEASLLRALEKAGIGRPSTWAAIIENIKNRNYIEIKAKKVCSTPVGRALIDALADMRFAEYNYTANLEEALDHVANGEIKFTDVINLGWSDLETDLETKMGRFVTPAIAAKPAPASKKSASGSRSTSAKKTGSGQPSTARQKSATPPCPNCGAPTVKRKGQYSEFWGCSTFPTCRGLIKI